MAGLIPAIHVLILFKQASRDAREPCGHDGFERH
jgi:hypothetical protein